MYLDSSVIGTQYNIDLYTIFYWCFLLCTFEVIFSGDSPMNVQYLTRSQGLMAHLIYLNSYEINLSDLSHSQICQRVRSVICEAVWEAVRVQSVRPICESEVRGRVGGRSASHAHRVMLSDPRLNALLRPVEVRLARCAWESDRPPTWPPTSASQIGLSDRSHDFVVRGRARPPTASHLGLSDRPCDLWGRSVRPKWEAVRVRSDSTERGNAFSHEISQIAPRIGLSADRAERPCAWEALIGSDRSHDKLWEAEVIGGHGRPWEAEFGRPWEAVGGRAPLIGWGRSLSQWEEHGLPRPPKFPWKCLKI